MENRSPFYFLCFVILTFAIQAQVGSGAAHGSRISREPPIEARLCPSDAAISPCTCEYDTLRESAVVIRCSRYPVDQTSIETVMKELRRVNDIPEDRGVDISWFIISETEMTQFDFSPFYGSRFGNLNLVANSFLRKVVNSGDPSDFGSIHAFHFTIMSSRTMLKEGYGDVLKYFSDELKELGAVDLALENNENGTEVLPELSTHTNLTELDISFNYFGRFNAGAFKGLQRLEKLDAQSQRDSKLFYIGENAFDFTADGAEDGDADLPLLKINLGLNNLNELSFHPNCGIGKAGRRTELVLYYNKITTIPVDFFQGFLEANPRSYIDLLEDPIFCDQKLSWLKARREEFERQFVNIICVNDPLRSPFDSKLVP